MSLDIVCTKSDGHSTPHQTIAWFYHTSARTRRASPAGHVQLLRYQSAELKAERSYARTRFVTIYPKAVCNFCT